MIGERHLRTSAHPPKPAAHRCWIGTENAAAGSLRLQIENSIPTGFPRALHQQRDRDRAAVSSLGSRLIFVVRLERS